MSESESTPSADCRCKCNSACACGNAKTLAAIKSIPALILAGFALFSLAYGITREARGGVGAALEKTSDGTIVWILHRTERCDACLTMERECLLFLNEKFPEALAKREIVAQSVDYQSPANRHLVSAFKLYYPTIVLEKRLRGKTIAWKNLDRAWELSGEGASLKEYLAEQCANFSKGVAP